MPILITADLHLSNNSRDTYRHNFMRWFEEQAIKLRVSHILILGDLTQNKDHHTAWLVNNIVNHIHNLAQICPVIILRGNHDYLHIDYPFFAFLNQIENVTWINIPTLKYVDGLNCLFLPHTRDYKTDWKGLLHDPHDWIFAHNTFDGADIGHGKRLSGIPQNIFRDDAYIVSGDVHIPQEIEKVIYVGAPYRINFGDDYQPRVIQIKKIGYASINCPGPHKQLIEVKSLYELKNQKHLSKGDILKIRFEITSNQYDKWQEIKDAVHRWGEDQGYIIEMIQPLLELQPHTRKRKQEFKTDEDLLRTYAKRVGISDQVLNTGLNLIKEK